MKTIIKITKQEAIEAWKLVNADMIRNILESNIEVEIEENILPKFYTGTQYIVGNGTTPLPSCPLCGKYGQHVCVTC